MNELTKIHATRRPFRDVTRVATPPDLTMVGRKTRRTLACAWKLEPLSSRLVCSWSQRACADGQPAPTDAGDRMASEIPIAA